MRNKFKKGIIIGILAGTIVVPSVAQAAGNYLTKGCVKLSASQHYGWADYSNHTVYVTISKGSLSKSSAGRNHASTAVLTSSKAPYVSASYS